MQEGGTDNEWRGDKGGCYTIFKSLCNFYFSFFSINWSLSFLPPSLFLFFRSNKLIFIYIQDAARKALQDAFAGDEDVGRLEIVVGDLGDVVGVAQGTAELRDE